MSYAAWPEHFTHTIGSEEILHVVHQRRCAVLSCWGAPTQTKKKFIFITLTTLFSKKNIKFKVALRPRLGLKPMVISVSNHGRRVVKPGTPSSTSCVSAVTSLVHSKHRTMWHRPTQAESMKRKSRPTLVIKNRTVARSWFNVHPRLAFRDSILKRS